ncbi:(2Fe-2S)-binding protein [Variovorax sp. KK3]|uniref:(2Fe-2S)-binding protein n=1 Tax=Variovorax sp. KK3 TaxID=1855728 RepID=UPI00097BBE3B|nr:2Fe-2S iron-sulfur cluster-binding protein [Variovorax sp. KK3]
MQLHVNGQAHELPDEPGAKAVYALRNDLRLHDVRLGCAEGHCGACTVLVDGKPTTTCDLPLVALDGTRVTTLQGLGSPDRPHVLQRAFLELQAGQCGYCLSGILMTAAALIAQPRPSSEVQVRAALDRHLCRCGTHGRIVQAVMRAQDDLQAQREAVA